MWGRLNLLIQCTVMDYTHLFDKPTRITQQSATLIDNIIFSNDMNNDIICGLLKNDISDHLPVFSISGHSITRHKYQQNKHILDK